MKNFFKNKNILVTGHTGFKGAWLSMILLSMGARVSGISLKPQNKRGSLYKIFKLKSSMKSYYVDLRNINKLNNTIKKVNPDMIFHLAAQPYMKNLKFKISGELTNTDIIMSDSLWIGVYPGLNEQMINYMIESIHEFFKSN